MTFFIKADTRAVEDALSNKLPAAYARESERGLEQVADGIIATIRRRRIWAKETVGVLKKGLWRGKVRFRKSGNEIDTGWSGEGAAFGPGHEFGFRKPSWKVAPVNTRASTKHSDKRIGQPIKALRFMVGGMVVYSKGHTVTAPKDLKPHFGPAADKFPIDVVMSRALDRAVKRAGLE